MRTLLFAALSAIFALCLLPGNSAADAAKTEPVKASACPCKCGCGTTGNCICGAGKAQASSATAPEYETVMTTVCENGVCRRVAALRLKAPATKTTVSVRTEPERFYHQRQAIYSGDGGYNSPAEAQATSGRRERRFHLFHRRR